MLTIQGLPNDRPIKSEDHFTLRHGQIVQGKVNKIYPNNRAEIQIGDKRLVAEIFTPLSVGKNYFFQVEQSEEQIFQLKVLSTHLKNDHIHNIAELMRNLNVPNTKINSHLFQMLIGERIPFEHQQIIAAVQLLEKFGGNPEILHTINEIIVRRLPLTEHILHSFMAYKNHSLSYLIKGVMQDISKHPQQSVAEKELQGLLVKLLPNSSNGNVNEDVSSLSKSSNGNNVSSTNELIKQIPSSLLRKMVQSLDALQFTSATEKSMRQSTQSMKRENLVQETIVGLSHLNKEQVRENALHILRESATLQTVVKDILRTYPIYTSAISDEQFSLLKKEITGEMLQLLPKNIQHVFTTLLQKNTSENQQMLSSLLQTMQTEEFYTLLLESVMNNEPEKQLNSQLTQIRFLHHFHQLLQTLGLGDEAMIKNALQMASDQLQDNNTKLTPTIKLLLTQIMQQEGGRVTEHMQQLSYFITGMQLQANENRNIIQIPLHLPGEKIGLPSDLFVKFEGKKTADGKIDADYCRILFMLDLFALKETVIDMHVQKRIISLTIYNEQSPTIKHQAQSLKEKLEDNLAAINYQLSSLKWKQLEEQTKPKESVITNKNESLEQKGFDMLI